VVSDEFRNPLEYAKPLTGAKPWQSLRVGDYRAIVRFNHEKQVMQVGPVGHRSSIYDEFPYGASASPGFGTVRSYIGRELREQLTEGNFAAKRLKYGLKTPVFGYLLSSCSSLFTFLKPVVRTLG
jgi:hypothetical protein